MYERFYNLRERPFALSPDPEYLYPSGVHREALDYLRYGIETQAGFIVITGEIGSGKTTLLQTVLQRLDSGTKVARLVNTTLEPRELLEAILLDFGVDLTSSSKPMMLRQLGEFLVRQRADGCRALLVIDEAQNLSVPALEEIRLLSNQETEKSKLLPIALVGQPNLRDKLRSAELEQLRQRVTVSYHLMPLDGPETHAYINHRLRRAALGEPMEFPSDAAAVVHARSRGVPRTINVICDATLVFGYGDERRDIDGALVEVVVAELEATGVLSPAGVVPAAPEAPAPVDPHGGAGCSASSLEAHDLTRAGRCFACAGRRFACPGRCVACASPGRRSCHCARSANVRSAGGGRLRRSRPAARGRDCGTRSGARQAGACAGRATPNHVRGVPAAARPRSELVRWSAPGSGRAATRLHRPKGAAAPALLAARVSFSRG